MKRSASARLLLAALVAAVAVTWIAPASAPCAPAELTVQQPDTQRYPSVSFTVSIPNRSADASEPVFTLVENGVDVPARVARATFSEAPTRIVLAMDTSGSMAGKPWEDAKRAAEEFLGKLDASVPVRVVSFDKDAVVRTDFTTDRAATIRALGRLEPAHETALYDALITSVRALGQPDGDRRVVVLLSDGGDTVSASTFGAAMSAIRDARVPLYAIALKSDEYDPRPLALLATSSGGRLVSARASDSLSRHFAGIAEELSSTFMVTYDSLQPSTKDIELDITARATGRYAVARIAYANPEYSTRAAGVPVALLRPHFDVTRMLLAVGLFFVAGFLVAWVAGSALSRERNMLSHVRYYDQEDRRSQWRGSLGFLMGWRGWLARRTRSWMDARGLTAKYTHDIEMAGLAKHPGDYLADLAVATAAVLVIVQVVFGQLLLTLIVAGAALLVPRAILNALRDRRRRAFEAQLPAVLSMFATSLRGGWSLERALELVAVESAQPAAAEFARVVAEVELGMPPHVAMEGMARRMQSDDFDAVVAGVTVQREVGGNLAEVLDTVSDAVRERDTLRRQVRTLTAEARLSAYILIALPFLLVLMMLLTSPTYIGALFTTPSGLAITGVAAAMLAGGSWWLYSLTKIEV